MKRGAGALLVSLILAWASIAPPISAQTPEPTVLAPVLPVTVTDSTGTTVTVSDLGRIVPLSGDIAEILWNLGLAEQIVATDVTAVYPPEVMDPLPKIGFERGLTPESILALEPTLVIGKTTAGPPETLAQLREAGVPVVIVDDHATLDGVIAKILAVGEAIGLDTPAQNLAAETQAELDTAFALAASATSQPRVAFLYVREGGVQLLGGQGSGADALIDAAGGIDVGAEMGVQGFIPITPEALVTASPEIIIAPASGVASAGGVEALLAIPGIAQTPAGEAGAILVYDDLEFLGLTPRIGEMLTELIYALHPDLDPSGQ